MQIFGHGFDIFVIDKDYDVTDNVAETQIGSTKSRAGDLFSGRLVRYPRVNDRGLQSCRDGSSGACCARFAARRRVPRCKGPTDGCVRPQQRQLGSTALLCRFDGFPSKKGTFFFHFCRS
jgi:hypothetical protein